MKILIFTGILMVSALSYAAVPTSTNVPKHSLIAKPMSLIHKAPASFKKPFTTIKKTPLVILKPKTH